MLEGWATRPHIFLQQPKIELLKHSIASGGRCSGGLEQVLQLVIVIPVQAANLRRLFSAFHLAAHHAVFAAVAHLQRQPAVGPELTLGTEAMRGSTRQLVLPIRH